MRTLFQTLLLALVAAVMTGCISFTTAQTARTLKEGETAGYGGLTYLTQTSETKDEEDNSTTNDDQKAYGSVAGARYGLNGSVDIGARASNMGVAVIETKLQLMDSRTMALAVGFGLGLSSSRYKSETKDEEGNDAGDTTSASTHRLSEIPLYASVDMSKTLALYSALRYVYIHSEQDSLSLGSDDDDDQDVSSARLLGLTAGVMVQTKPGFFAEFAYYMSPDKDADVTGLQVSTGLAFNQP